MDISLDCANCGQHIVIDEAGAGLQVECPACGAALVIPRTQTGQAQTRQPVRPPPIPPPLSLLCRHQFLHPMKFLSRPVVLQDSRAKCKATLFRANIADLIQVFGWLGCASLFLLGLRVLGNGESFGLFLVPASLGVASGMVALYALARGNKLRRELPLLAKRAQEEQATHAVALARESAARDAMLAREKAAQVAAYLHRLNILPSA